MAVNGVIKGDCLAGFTSNAGTIIQNRAIRVVNDLTNPPIDRAGFEIAAGASVTLTYKRINNTGGNAPTAVTIKVYYETGTGTLISTLLNAAADPADGATFTFWGTSDGTSGGAPRSGTLRLYLLLAGGSGTSAFSVDSDGASSFGTLFVAPTTHCYQGVLRSNMVVTALAASGAGGAQFGRADTLTMTATHTQKYGATGVETVRLDVTDSTDTQKIAGTSGVVDAGTSFVQTQAVDNRFSAALANYGIRFLPIGNSALVPTSGAILWTAMVASGVTQEGNNVKVSSAYAVDPRISFMQELQVNDSTFGTPPSIKNIASGARQVSELGFLAARATDANGVGINGLVWTEKLWDAGNLVGSEASPVHSRSTTSQTQDGEAGWSDAFLTWADSLPGGNWTQKEIITSPSGSMGLEHNNTRTLSLLAKNPNFVVVPASGLNTSDLDHFRPGTPYIGGGTLIDFVNRLFPSVDVSPSPYAIIGRFNLALARVEVLNDVSGTPTWQSASATVGSWTKWTLTQSPGDSNAWIVTFTGTQTANWAYKPLIFPILYNNGTPYGQPAVVELMGTANYHNKWHPIREAIG